MVWTGYPSKNKRHTVLARATSWYVPCLLSSLLVVFAVSAATPVGLVSAGLLVNDSRLQQSNAVNYVAGNIILERLDANANPNRLIASEPKQYGLREGDSVQRGDVLKTGNGARAHIVLGEDTVLELGANTDLRIGQFLSADDRNGGLKAWLQLRRGELRIYSLPVQVARERRFQVDVANSGPPVYAQISGNNIDVTARATTNYTQQVDVATVCSHSRVMGGEVVLLQRSNDNDLLSIDERIRTYRGNNDCYAVPTPRSVTANFRLEDEELFARFARTGQVAEALLLEANDDVLTTTLARGADDDQASSGIERLPPVPLRRANQPVSSALPTPRVLATAPEEPFIPVSESAAKPIEAPALPVPAAPTFEPIQESEFAASVTPAVAAASPSSLPLSSLAEAQTSQNEWTVIQPSDFAEQVVQPATIKRPTSERPTNTNRGSSSEINTASIEAMLAGLAPVASNSAILSKPVTRAARTWRVYLMSLRDPLIADQQAERLRQQGLAALTMRYVQPNPRRVFYRVFIEGLPSAKAAKQLGQRLVGQPNIMGYWIRRTP